MEGVPTMEIREGNVSVEQVPSLKINDKLLQECELSVVKKEILALVKKVGEQRKRIIELEEKNANR
jgi:hypothetical protein